MITFLLLILAFLTTPTDTAFASVSYSVTPLVIDEKIEPRDIFTREITVTNTGSQPVTVYPSVNNISLQEGGTIQEFLPPVESDRTASLASWLEISRLGFDLKVGESKTIPITFRVHAQPVPGIYHAFIGFGNGRNRDEAEAQVARGQAPGVIITATFEDTKSSLLKLSTFFVERFVAKKDNQAAVYTFTNSGEEVVVPKGEIILYDTTGKEVGTLPVNAENKSINPGEEYTFTANVPIEDLFGKYKAFLSIEYGSQRAVVQDTSFFYALPLHTIVLFLSILLTVLGILAWYIHKKYFDTQDDDSERLFLRIRETQSDPKHHDVHITKP